MTDAAPLITGFGAVTPLGDEVAFRAAWLDGARAVVGFEGDRAGLPPGFGAPVRFEFKELRALPGGRGLRPGTMTAPTFLAAGAVGRALASAGILDPEADPVEVLERRAVFLGSCTNFPDWTRHLQFTRRIADPAAAALGEYRIDDGRIGGAMKGMTGFEFLKLMNNMPTAHASVQAGSRGPANTLLGSPASGLQAIGRALDALALGQADQAIAGGAGPGLLDGLCHWRRAAGLLARAAESPGAGSLPLDQRATGLVPGEAGAAIFLETAASAAARGATPLARLCAFEERWDAPAAPWAGPGHAGPLRELLEATLDAAGWAAADVDLVVPAALGHPLWDRWEAAALGAVFPASGLRLQVHTQAVGFVEGAHGPLGLVGALQAFDDGRIAASGWPAEPWPGLPAEPGAGGPPRRAVVLAGSLHGVTAAVAVERL